MEVMATETDKDMDKDMDMDMGRGRGRVMDRGMVMGMGMDRGMGMVRGRLIGHSQLTERLVINYRRQWRAQEYFQRVLLFYLIYFYL